MRMRYNTGYVVLTFAHNSVFFLVATTENQRVNSWEHSCLHVCRQRFAIAPGFGGQVLDHIVFHLNPLFSPFTLTTHASFFEFLPDACYDRGCLHHFFF